jgi:Ca-activated chloride channel family protein
MNDSKILPDDPQLTAYALGEMDAAERVAFEVRLQNDPSARTLVAEIRGLANQLEQALRSEISSDGIRPARMEERESAHESAKGDESLQGRDHYPGRKGKVLSFPHLYYLVGGLAAACFAVVMALRLSEPRRIAIQKHYEQVALPLSPETEGTEIAAVEKMPPVESVVVDTPTPPEGLAKIAAPAVRLAPSDLSLLGGSHGASLPLAQGLIIAGMDEAFNPAKFASKPRSSRQLVGGARAVALSNAQLTHGNAADGRTPVEISPVTAEGSTVATADRIRRELTSATGSRSTLAGTRVRTELMDVGSPITVVTREYLSSGSLTGASKSNREVYAFRPESEFVRTVDEPLSTFSADVDTASYANVRRFLKAGELPPKDAVRIEELVNYFPYEYAAPKTEKAEGGALFAASLEVAEAPWAAGHRLVRIGLKAKEVSAAARGPANLVFLLDVSGSMAADNRLPLVKESLRLLLRRLRSDDRVAIVTYAGTSGLALPSTPVAQSREILAVLDRLTASGGTNGGMGIQLAYDIAKANFVGGGINRVILCTDGDFNVGVTGEGELVRLIEEKAKSGVFLTVLGFGMGNLQDATMQQLADHGNGDYAYIDTREEAEKLLVRQLGGTLVTVAKDVKIQVEFNPAKIASYRLIGYEKRLLKAADFNRDSVDAGEVGSGHTVTALYEVVPTDPPNNGGNAQSLVDPLRYGAVDVARAPGKGSFGGNLENAARSEELLLVKVRFKDPAGIMGRKLEFPLLDGGGAFAAASEDFKFAAAVAGFGLVLRDSPFKGTATFASVATWANAGLGPDRDGYREEFLGLVKQAQAVVQ